MSMLAPANTYDVSCPKMVAVCILRCNEHPNQTRLLCAYIDAPRMRIKPGCSVHTSMRRACVLNQVAPCIHRCTAHANQTRLLCAYIDAPSMRIKPGCSVHTSMHRACKSNQVALCILRCAEQVYRKSKLHACLLKRFYDSPSLYVSLQHWILSMHARKNIYLL